jgi:hypothetical protein
MRRSCVRSQLGSKYDVHHEKATMMTTVIQRAIAFAICSVLPPSTSALLPGWVVGLFGVTYLAWTDGLEPLHALTFADTTVTAYVGLIALVANVVIAVLVNFAMTLRKQTPGWGDAINQAPANGRK